MTLKREEIQDKYKWRLEDIFYSDDEWERVFKELDREKDEILKFKGKLSDKKTLLSYFKFSDSISKKITDIYVYARMKKDENVAETKYVDFTERADNLSVKISSLSSFVSPELVSLDEDYLKECARDKEFSDYSYKLEKFIKNKKHILSSEAEKILAEVGSFSESFQNIFTMFDNADVRFKDVVMPDGTKVEMSHGVYGLLLQNPSREVRKQAYDSMFDAYAQMINTVSEIYAGNVKQDWFYAKTRGYKSCLEHAMNVEDADEKVYFNLLESVGENCKFLSDYIEFRRKKLNLDKIAFCDLHVPLFENAELSLEYDDAYSLVEKALSVLGEEYISVYRSAKNERWIDVFETKNKRSGAYSWGTYNSHPYVLLNYHKTTHDVFTIAHEMGHAIHSYYSNKNQPYAKAGYEIFVAEVASTVNEMLLLRYLLSQSKDSNMKKFLLSYLIDMIRTTLFRQTQFAEFEFNAHKLVEENKSLNAETLNELYLDLNKKYYGKNIDFDKIKYEWARIPHFYNSFYVYKYSTGIISAIAISENIINKTTDSAKNYIEFLKAGGSASPVDILKIAGVDLTTKEPFDKAMKVFKETLKELKSE